MSKLIHHLITAATIIVASLTITSITLMIFGLRPFILQSGSMEPLYPRGSLIWIDTRTSMEELNPGEVVAYRAETGILIMHRLIALDSDSAAARQAVLKGDANRTHETVTLSPANYIGREVLFIPGIGRFLAAVIRFPWLIWILAASLMIIACSPELPAVCRKH